jgi:hypothetical protein
VHRDHRRAEVSEVTEMTEPSHPRCPISFVEHCVSRARGPSNGLRGCLRLWPCLGDPKGVFWPSIVNLFHSHHLRNGRSLSAPVKGRTTGSSSGNGFGRLRARQRVHVSPRSLRLVDGNGEMAGMRNGKHASHILQLLDASMLVMIY